MLLLGNLQVQIINVHMEPEIIMTETMKESLKDTVAFSKKDYMMKDNFMHTDTQIRKCNCNTTQPFYGPFSGTTRVRRYQKKQSPNYHPDHHPIFISFFHLPWSIASSLFKLRAWESFCTTSLHVLFGLPLGLEPSTSYAIHFFTQRNCKQYS